MCNNFLISFQLWGQERRKKLVGSPLQRRRDYGEVNPYLNISPTELAEKILEEKDLTKKR